MEKSGEREADKEMEKSVSSEIYAKLDMKGGFLESRGWSFFHAVVNVVFY